VTRFRWDYGSVVLAGTPPPLDGGAESYAPRRTVLDSILVEVAAQAGAKVRTPFTVDRVVMDGDRITGARGHARGGAPLEERARLVVGADDRRSLVARAVAAPAYRTRPLPEALAGYQRRRDEGSTAMYELTCQGAALEPPAPQMTQLIAALRGNQGDTDRFLGVVAGTVAIPEFFAPATSSASSPPAPPLSGADSGSLRLHQKAEWQSDRPAKQVANLRP
jgi:2-polyprenyl-6-methoxyphenol hydroxylase-like FAD-dependent oxidoreductase